MLTAPKDKRIFEVVLPLIHDGDHKVGDHGYIEHWKINDNSFIQGIFVNLRSGHIALVNTSQIKAI